MDYVVYCDESRHDANVHKFMAIGSLWLPRAEKEALSHAFRDHLRKLGLKAEVKWKKTSAAKLQEYKSAVDFFFDSASLRFRVIVVELSKLNNHRWNEGDEELGFYKFYYELLEKWIDPHSRYLLLLDYKNNKGSDRYTKLRDVLTKKHGVGAIAALETVDSSETPLAQLTDILTGAVAASWNDPKTGAKQELAKHIASRMSRSSLRVADANPTVNKFNIFRIDLQG